MSMYYDEPQEGGPLYDILLDIVTACLRDCFFLYRYMNIMLFYE